MIGDIGKQIIADNLSRFGGGRVFKQKFGQYGNQVFIA
jgi:hypothetical protein